MKPPDDFVFFVDRSLGKEILASALRLAGLRVEVHDDHFPPDAKDQQWLSVVGRNRWIVLTKDKKIRHRAPELAAVRTAKVRMFTLTAGSVQAAEMADIFLRSMPQIRAYLQSHEEPFIVSVTRSGKVSQVYP